MTRRTLLVVVIPALVVAACGAGGAGGGAQTPPTTSALPPATTSTLPPTTTESAADASSPTVADASLPETSGELPAGRPHPAYDVFLAAVAEAVAETRFATVPFDEPELTASTGLALCAALTEGEDPDRIVLDFLGELTGGEPASADPDQLALTGALIGAAESALCPSEA